EEPGLALRCRDRQEVHVDAVHDHGQCDDTTDGVQAHLKHVDPDHGPDPADERVEDGDHAHDRDDHEVGGLQAEGVQDDLHGNGRCEQPYTVREQPGGALPWATVTLAMSSRLSAAAG